MIVGGKSPISNFHGLLKQDPNGSLLNEMVSPIPCIISILQHFLQKEEGICTGFKRGYVRLRLSLEQLWLY